MQRPVVVLNGPWRPHEMLLLAVGVLSTVAYLVGGPPPGSIVAVLPTWAVGAFYLLLGVGSAVGLAGCILRRAPFGSGLEQGGLLIQAAALLMYAVAVLVFAGASGAGLVIILGGWLVADVWRAWQIQGNIRALRQASRS